MTTETTRTSEEYLDYLTGIVRNYTLTEILKETSIMVLPRMSRSLPLGIAQLLTKAIVDPELAQQLTKVYISKFERSVSLDEFQLAWIEILICRDVQVFDYYLSRMLTKVFTQRREVLKGLDYSIKISDLLECADINEAILRASEKKIHDLGYLGLSDIVQYLKSNFKMKIDTTSEEFRNACEMFEIRNILVHNGGYVSAKFLAKTQRSEFKFGDKFPLTEESAVKMGTNLTNLALRLDQEFMSHFKLT